MARSTNKTRIRKTKTLNVLLHGDIVVEGLLPYSSNYTMLTSVTYESTMLHAVYKPRVGERQLWDFPEGTLYLRETAAYLVSEALGFFFVPPTVIRDGPYGVGAVQLFIDHDPEVHLFTIQQEGGYESDLLRLAAFDCLINNADRKSGHCLRDSHGRLWMIDHGICFHQECKLRTVLWDFADELYPPYVLTALHTFKQWLDGAQKEVAHTLDVLLSAVEMQALRQRLESMLTTGVYPSPGPGFPIPWPPV